MTDAAGYILVGGKSSRLGRDKALVEVGGRPLVLRVTHAVQTAVDEVTLVGAPEKYGHLGLRVIPDHVTGFGPLAGILAALEDTSRPWNLVAACDMPNLTPEFLGFLLRRAAEEQAEILGTHGRDRTARAAVRRLLPPPAVRRSGAPSKRTGTRSPTRLRICV